MIGKDNKKRRLKIKRKRRKERIRMAVKKKMKIIQRQREECRMIDMRCKIYYKEIEIRWKRS